MKADILASYPALDEARLHVVYNGIDTDFYRPDPDTTVLERIGVDPTRPYVAFVGRITRQKGVPHLLRAGLAFDRDLQIVLLSRRSGHPRAVRPRPTRSSPTCARSATVSSWVSEMLPREEVRQVLTGALAFLCPSVYEPLGNREPRGDGVRDRGGRQQRRRHPGGRDGRRDRRDRGVRRRGPSRLRAGHRRGRETGSRPIPTWRPVSGAPAASGR